jgi:hypothetical protein
MHTRVFFRVNASKGVSKINIWQDLNVRFGSLAVTQSIAPEWLLSGVYRTLTADLTSVCFRSQKRPLTELR